MITGLTYLATSLCLWILIYYLGESSGHETINGIDVYRYPRIAYLIFLFSMPIDALVGCFIYSTFPTPRPEGIELYLFILFFLSVEFLLGLAYLYIKKYRITIDQISLQVHGLTKIRTIPFKNIQKIKIIPGARGGQELFLMDAQGKCLLNIGSTLQDFDSLIFKVKRSTLNTGVILHERDQSGQWKEAVNEEHPHWVFKKKSFWD